VGVVFAISCGALTTNWRPQLKGSFFSQHANARDGPGSALGHSRPGPAISRSSHVRFAKAKQIIDMQGDRVFV
jgi:hypothetical protein